MGALSELRKKYGLDPYASNRDKPAVLVDPKTGRQTAVPRSMPREESERAANDGSPSSASEPKDVRSSLYGKTKEMREKRKENALKKSEEDLIKSRENRRQTSAREKYANRDKELTDAKTAVDTAALDNDKAVLEEALYNLYTAQESSFDRAVAKAESKLEQAKRQNENNKSRAISAAGAKAEQLKQSQDLAQPKQELESARAAQYYHNQNKTVAAIEEDIKNSPEYFAALNEVQQEGNTSGGNIHERGMVQGTYGQRKIDAVTDEQKAVQRVLEQRGDTEKLADYNEYLSQTTNKQLAEEDYEKLQNSGKVAQLLGYLGGGLGGAASWGATGVENIRRALGGEYRPIDTNSEWYSGSRVQAQAEEELLKDIDSPAARWFAQAGLSLADMAVKLPFGPVGMMAAFGAETAGNVAYDSLQRGATPDQAFANGTIAGLAEGLVSAIPVDRLFKVARGGASALLSKQGVKQVLQQAGLEANEELITQYAQTIADIATMGNKSNWALEYQDYIAQGYSDKEAKEMTNFDFFIKEPLLAAAAGGMMGGIMGAGATAKSGGLSNKSAQQTDIEQLGQALDSVKEQNAGQMAELDIDPETENGVQASDIAPEATQSEKSILGSKEDLNEQLNLPTIQLNQDLAAVSEQFPESQYLPEIREALIEQEQERLKEEYSQNVNRLRKEALEIEIQGLYEEENAANNEIDAANADNTANNSLTQAGNKEPASSMPETKGIEKYLGASKGQGDEALSQFANKNIQNAAESDRVSREIASALAGKTHKISSREKVADKARETINKYGMEAIADYLNKKAINNKAATDTEIAAGIMAIQEYSRLSRQNSQGSNDEYGAKALDLANVMDSLATTAGRALNMYKIIQKELPGGLLRYANRQLQKENLPPLEQDEINTFNDLLEMSKRAEELNDLTEQIIKDKKSLLNKDKIRGKAALKAIEAKIAEMFPDMSKEYRGYAAQILLYKDSSEIGDWMTLLTQKMVADKKPATAVDKYRAYQRINLLLNTKTNLRNIGGNAMQTILETTSDMVGTGIDKLIAGKTGNRTVAMPSAKAAWEGAIKGGSDAVLAYRTNTLGIQGDNRYADNQVSPSDVFSNGNILGRTGNPLNKATSFLLTFGDKIFSGSREAVVKQELTQLREQGKLDITDEEIAEIARRQALQVTYQDDTGLSDFIINTRHNISGETKAKRKNSSPNAIRTLFAYTTLPFAKTPANVLYRTLEYSAPGLVKSCIDVAKIRKGGWDITPAQQRRLVSAVSKGIVGVGLEGLGAILFANNLLSGSAPDDEAEKKEREMLGITDNSVKVKVGDKYYWVDFSSLGPLPAAMNVGANIYKEITDEFGEDPSVAAAALDVIKTMLAAPINDVTGDSLWEGIIDIADYAHENDVAGLIQEVLGDAAVQMVPLSSFMRAVTTLTDPYVRETSSEGEIGWTGNRIISQIPFLSSTLPVKYDVHGEAKKRAIGDNFADKLYSAFFAIGNASEDKSKDEVVEELLRLYNDSEDSSVLLDKAPYSIKKGGETYPLVGENRSQYQHTMGSLGKGTVNELINSPEFNYATTEQQIDMVAKALGYGKDTAKTDFFDQTEVAYDKDSYKLKYRLDRAKSYGVAPGVAVAVYDRMGKVDGNGPKATILINTAGLTKDQQKKIAHDYFGESSETFSNNLATAIDNNYAEEFVNAYTRKNSYKYDIEQVSDYLNATGLNYRQKAKIMEMLNWGYGGKRSPKQYTKYLN